MTPRRDRSQIGIGGSMGGHGHGVVGYLLAAEGGREIFEVLISVCGGKGLFCIIQIDNVAHLNRQFFACGALGLKFRFL